MQSPSIPCAEVTYGSTPATPHGEPSPREGFPSDASSYMSSDAGTPQTPQTPAGEEEEDFGFLQRCRSAPAKPKASNPVRAAAAASTAQVLSFKDVNLPKGGVAKSPRTLSKEKDKRLSKAELKRGTE